MRFTFATLAEFYANYMFCATHPCPTVRGHAYWTRKWMDEGDTPRALWNLSELNKALCDARIKH